MQSEDKLMIVNKRRQGPETSNHRLDNLCFPQRDCVMVKVCDDLPLALPFVRQQKECDEYQGVHVRDMHNSSSVDCLTSHSLTLSKGDTVKETQPKNDGQILCDKALSKAANRRRKEKRIKAANKNPEYIRITSRCLHRKCWGARADS